MLIKEIINKLTNILKINITLIINKGIKTL